MTAPKGTAKSSKKDVGGSPGKSTLPSDSSMFTKLNMNEDGAETCFFVQTFVTQKRVSEHLFS